jgi:membrane protein DedA with SNARE-associated domain
MQLWPWHVYVDVPTVVAGCVLSSLIGFGAGFFLVRPYLRRFLQRRHDRRNQH